MERVLLRNPETGDTWECPERAADFWVNEKGWKREAAKSTTTSARRRGDTAEEKSNG